jgi:hypothetical protein
MDFDWMARQPSSQAEQVGSVEPLHIDLQWVELASIFWIPIAEKRKRL